MEIDETRFFDKLDRIAEDSAATRADVANLRAHINAVSANQKTTASHLQEHKDDPKAHGFGAVIQWVGLAMGSIATILHLSKKG